MESEKLGWCVVRLVTVQKKRQMGRLLFSTVTELTSDRPLPTSMQGIDCCQIPGSEYRLFFRRTILSQEEARAWYLSLGEGERSTPIPTREEDRAKSDGQPFWVSKLEDDQPWPAFGLPIRDEFISRSGRAAVEPAPFIGSVPGRLHRRFGDRTGLEDLLVDANVQAFLTRRMHINLFEYQEYLGSVIYIVPDPIVREIDNFMVPATDKLGERIVYRIVPRPNQTLSGLSLTTFDKEARLLTRFETHQVPLDGILEIEKGTCMGEYGFILTHEREGILAYQPSVSYLRQMNFSMRVNSPQSRKVNVPLGESQNSPRIDYPAAAGSEFVSKSVLGKVVIPGVGERVAVEARKRERRSDAQYYGQRWFPADSRREAAYFIQELFRSANRRVTIADPYLGALQLGQFLYSLHGSEVAVTLLTTSLAFNQYSKTKLDLARDFEKKLKDLEIHQKLSPEVLIISSSVLHDRFLVIDEEVWFVGSSLNSLGEKASMIVKLPNPQEVIDRLEIIEASAQSLAAYIQELPAQEEG